MSQQPTNSLTVDEALKLYETYRSYVRHEDYLINFRTTWFIAIQGGLFTIYGFAIQKHYEIQMARPKSGDMAPSGQTMSDATSAVASHAVMWTPYVGMLMCLATFISVYAAYEAGSSVKAHSRRHGTVFAVYNLPAITGGGTSIAALFGSIVSFFLPIAICAVWIVSSYFVHID